MFVAPQVPSGPVNCRCIALRATWPSAAMMVKGIQRLVTVSMGGGRWEISANVQGAARAVNRADVMGAMLALQTPLSSLRKQGPITPGDSFRGGPNPHVQHPTPS